MIETDRRNKTRVRLGRVIASRTLGEVGVPKSKIVVSIGAPRSHPQHDWDCPFLIEGLGVSNIQHAYGVDAMQALIISLQGIRASIEKSGRKLFWFEAKTGTFFPMLVPAHFGREFEDRVGLAIEREIVREWRARIRSRQAKIRAHEAKLSRQGTATAQIARAVAKWKKDADEWESRVDKLKPGWMRLVPTNKPHRAGGKGRSAR